MEQFISALQRFGIGRLAAIIGVSAGVAAALFALILNFGSPPQSLLYSNLDLKEASTITAALDQAGIKYDAKGDGSTIFVARDKVGSTRMLLAGKGLPSTGSVGYEIFDQTNALGQTDFVQNLNHQRALEGEDDKHPLQAHAAAQRKPEHGNEQEARPGHPRDRHGKQQQHPEPDTTRICTCSRWWWWRRWWT